MLKRDSKTGRLLKQPVKVGDLVVCLHYVIGFTKLKPYKVVATESSSEKNRTCFGRVIGQEHAMPGLFVFFVIDDDGDKRWCVLGSNKFGHTWEKLPK